MNPELRQTALDLVAEIAKNYLTEELVYAVGFDFEQPNFISLTITYKTHKLLDDCRVRILFKPDSVLLHGSQDDFRPERASIRQAVNRLAEMAFLKDA